MSLRVSGKTISVGEALRIDVTDRLRAATAKFFEAAPAGARLSRRKARAFAPIALFVRPPASFRTPTGAPMSLTLPSVEPPVASRSGFVATGAGRRIATPLMTVTARPSRAASFSRSTGKKTPLEFGPGVITESMPRSSASVLELDFSGTSAVVFRHVNSGRGAMRPAANNGGLTQHADIAPLQRGISSAYILRRVITRRLAA